MTARSRCRQWRVFGFAGVTPAIWGQVHSGGRIEIGIDYRGETWALLADFDLAPMRLATGAYVCAWCEESARTVYRTRDALWIEHGFEPLLAWCNDHFQPDRQIGLFQTDGGGATWATLRRGDGARAFGRQGLVAVHPLLTQEGGR